MSAYERVEISLRYFEETLLPHSHFLIQTSFRMQPALMKRSRENKYQSETDDSG
jgi:hypothetical protein